MEELEVRVNKNGIKTWWSKCGSLMYKECAICGEIIQVRNEYGDTCNGDWKDSKGVWHEDHHICKKMIGDRKKEFNIHRTIPSLFTNTVDEDLKTVVSELKDIRWQLLDRNFAYRTQNSYKLCNDILWELEILKNDILKSRLIEREI